MPNPNQPINQKDIRRARQLRQNMPLAEKILWHRLRQIPKEQAISFRRQQPIPPYIVDFVCFKHKLIIELDGPSHDSRQQQDAARDRYLKAKNYKILRFANEDVLKDPDSLIATILAQIDGSFPNMISCNLLCETGFP